MTPENMARIHRESFTRQRSWTAQEFASLCSQPGVIEVSTNHGFALVRAVETEAELLTIAVAPHAQGQGLGSRLLTTQIAAARAFGASELFLEVAAGNIAALALYRQTGFRRVGERKKYYRYPDGESDDALLFRRDLVEKNA